MPKQRSPAAHPSAPRHSSWLRALYLGERVESFREGGALPALEEIDGSLARRRLERWTAQAPFQRGDFFARRLEAEGITEQQLAILLGESDEDLAGRLSGLPGWTETLLRAYGDMPSPGEDSAEAGFTREDDGPGAPGFMVLAEPVVRQALQRVQQAAEGLARTHGALPFEPEDVDGLLLADLPARLGPWLQRTLVLELQVARMEGRLHGETAEERSANFMDRLREPAAALDFLARYPVLARRMVEEVEQWASYGLEVLTHLCEDLHEVGEKLNGGTHPGRLDRLRTGAGDSHRGGRSVAELRFDSGLRLIYKPRSLAAEAAFQRFLAWCNEAGLEPEFRLLKVLDREDHGWVEFVESAPCETEGELDRFYQRQGSFLALLYLLGATDFYFENLVAAGEHPMPVDLESVFHPWLGGRDLNRPQGDVGFAVQDTVMRVGLLPQRVWIGDQGAGVDLSGLGGSSRQSAPDAGLRLSVEGPGGARMESGEFQLPEAANRPTLRGEAVRLSDWVGSLEEGFERTWRFLMQHGEELADPEGPLSVFAGVETRILLRTTRSYAGLLAEVAHPHALGSGLEFDRRLDRLWVGVPDRPFLERGIRAEQRDLRRGDIPIFSARSDSRHLWASDGECIENFLPDTGLERTRRRAEGLSEEALARQTWVIRGSLTAVALEERAVEGTPTWTLEEAAEAPSRDELLAASRKAADRLAELSFHGVTDAQWLIVQGFPDNRWSLLPAEPDLYNGLSGIALYLAYLGEVTGEERHGELARATVVTMEHQFETLSGRISSIGGYTGWGSFVYGLTHLASLWGEPSLLDRAESLLEHLPPRIEGDESLDLLAGSAGCLSALLTLHAARPSERALELAVLCGERLLETARPMERGVGWVMPQAGSTPLAGLAHGAGGIALALLRLEAETRRSSFRETALEALEYERSVFVPEAGNWPDLREIEGQESGYRSGGGSFMTAWCHGAPGVGFSRLGMLPHLDDERVRDELSVAVETTLERGFGRNHCLCHGDLGNLDFLLEVARTTGDDELHRRVGRLAGGILRSIDERGWLYGMPGLELPGLMLGLAGVGYGLLRLAEPERVPCVLLLERPADDGATP